MRRRQEEGRKDARGPQKEEGGEREKSQGSYRKPQEVTGSHRKSQEATGSHRKQQGATGSDRKRQDATGSYRDRILVQGRVYTTSEEAYDF